MIELFNIINTIFVEYAGISNFLTIIVSVILSVYITGKRNRTVLGKIKLELAQTYSKSLFDKRVDIYPSLSAILGGYKKIILHDENDENNFCVFIGMLDKWNTKNSLFFSRATANFSEMSRLYFRYLSKKLDFQNESESHGKIENKLSEDDWKDIYQILGDFEIILRADIRMVHAKPPGNADDVKTIIDSLEKKIKNLPDKENIEPFKSTKLTK